MQITDVPGALVVHPSVPVKSTAEFVAYLKANPGKLNYGSPGAGSANRLEMEMFRILTGTQMTHVPYKGGAGQAVTALLGNEVQTMFVTFTSVVSFVKQGRLRMLGVVSPSATRSCRTSRPCRSWGIASSRTALGRACSCPAARRIPW
jgi:tripartite-type tricarboxylate transporter receptor subunit TctC